MAAYCHETCHVQADWERTGISSRTLRLAVEYGLTLPFNGEGTVCVCGGWGDGSVCVSWGWGEGNDTQVCSGCLCV